MTRRERLEARAERRRQWADSRHAKAAVVAKEAEKYRGDYAFNTQPGHIPERARLIARQERSFEDTKMAQRHESKAGGIERQLETSIFSDDPGAIEALQNRIEQLEGTQSRMVRVNAAWRKAGKPKPDNEEGWQKVAELVECSPDDLRSVRMNQARDFRFGGMDRGPFPAYLLSNNKGNIGRLKERIKTVTRQKERSTAAEAAGGVVIEGTGDYVSITFAEKPEWEVLNELRAAGFYWSGGSWNGARAKIPASVAEVVEDADAEAGSVV